MQASQDKLRKFVILLITWVLLFGFFLAYDTYFVNSQKEFLLEREFRSLAGLARTVQAEFDRARVAAESGVKLAAPAPGRPADLQCAKSSADTDDCRRKYIDFYLDGVLLRDESPEAIPKCWGPPGIDREIPLQTTQADGQLKLTVRCFTNGDDQHGIPNSTSVKKLFVLDISPWIRAALLHVTESFEHILIADTDGHVLFEQGSGGIHIRDLSSIVASSSEIGVKQPGAGFLSKGNPERGAAEAAANAGRKLSDLFERSAASQVLVGGKNYLLFSHPIRTVLGSYPTGGTPLDLVVCGFRRAGGLDAESRSLPYGFLIWVSLAAIVLLSISWPLFKLRYMGNSERFSPRDGWYLILALFLMSTGAAMMLLNASYIRQARDAADQEMRDLARQIKENFTAEIKSAFTQLRELRNDGNFAGARMDAKAPSLLGSYLRDSVRPNRPLVYPYFQIAFWADCHGHQLLKFDVRPAPTPSTDISRFEFFKNGMAQILKKNPSARDGLDDPCPEVPIGLDLDNSTDGLYLQALMSPNTDEFAPALSAPFRNGSENSKKISIQALLLRPMSVVDPVLPPGYRFAIIDDRCQVLFHSDSFRNLRENFCEESKGSNELQPWLVGGVDAPLDITYAGRTERARITNFPLPSLSATGKAFLVVFQDRDRELTFNLAIVLVCSILLAAYFAIVATLAVFHLLLRKPLSLTYAPRFMWPQPKNALAYIQVFCANAFVFAFYLTASRYLYEAPLLVLTMEAALLSAVFAIVRLACSPHYLYKWGRMIRAVAGLAIALIALSHLFSWVLSRSLPFLLPLDWASLFVLPFLLGWFAVLVSGRAPSTAGFRQDLAGVFDGVRKQFTAAYALAAVSLIACAALVPCFGSFKYAYDAVSEISLKHDQAVLADRLTARQAWARSYYDSLNAPAFAPCRVRQILDRYDKVSFSVSTEASTARSESVQDCQVLASEAGGARGSESVEKACVSQAPQTSNWLNDRIERVIAKMTLTFPSNENGMEMSRLGVASTESKDAWERFWNETQPRRFALCGIPNSRLQDLTIVSSYLPWDGLTAGSWGYLALFMIGLLFWLLSLSRQIFLTDVQSAPSFEVAEWKSVSDITGNYLVIGRTQSGKSKFLRELSGLDLRDWGDLRTELATMTKEQNYQIAACHGSVRVLDSFEFNICDPVWNRARLELLETLLYQERCRLVVVSTIDPLYFLSEEASKILSDGKDSNESSRLFDRWVRALSKFTRVTLAPSDRDEFFTEVAKTAERGLHHAQFGAWVCKECGSTSLLRRLGITILREFKSNPPASRAELAEIVLDRAGAYYRVLWSGLTASERLVLYQLALDGWANPKNAAAIQQLERKQLICKAPMYRLLNDSFCWFVQSGEHAAEIVEWEKHEQESTWHAFRFVLIGFLVGGGVWLLYTQAQLFQIGTGTITAIATFLTAVAGFSARFRRPSGASEARASVASQGAGE
jgi:hypothetical protein